MKRLSGSEQPLFDLGSHLRFQQNLQNDGGVRDDHRRLRSTRNISAGETLYCTGVLVARRSVSSFSVGRSATCSISFKRKSDKESPSRAARDFSRRCRGSGTLRI